jgi:AcrR family transcriptional regulator
MKDNRDRILDVAIELAEKGGYDNVRQRDVAAHAGVALGTLYKRFRSKEEILCAALERETGSLEKRLVGGLPRGESAEERLSSFFRMATRGLCRKPNFARAVLRALASGEPEVAAAVASYQHRMTHMITAVMRGHDNVKPAVTKREATVALLFQQIWFASLVGWSAGLFDESEIIAQMKRTTDLLLRGAAATPEPRVAKK